MEQKDEILKLWWKYLSAYSIQNYDIELHRTSDALWCFITYLFVAYLSDFFFYEDRIDLLKLIFKLFFKRKKSQNWGVFSICAYFPKETAKEAFE